MSVLSNLNQHINPIIIEVSGYKNIASCTIENDLKNKNYFLGTGNFSSGYTQLWAFLVTAMKLPFSQRGKNS
jgi:hypothetical protein